MGNEHPQYSQPDVDQINCGRHHLPLDRHDQDSAQDVTSDCEYLSIPSDFEHSFTDDCPHYNHSREQINVNKDDVKTNGFLVCRESTMSNSWHSDESECEYYESVSKLGYDSFRQSNRTPDNTCHRRQDDKTCRANTDVSEKDADTQPMPNIDYPLQGGIDCILNNNEGKLIVSGGASLVLAGGTPAGRLDHVDKRCDCVGQSDASPACIPVGPLPEHNQMLVAAAATNTATVSAADTRTTIDNKCGDDTPEHSHLVTINVSKTNTMMQTNYSTTNADHTYTDSSESQSLCNSDSGIGCSDSAESTCSKQSPTVDDKQTIHGDIKEKYGTAHPEMRYNNVSISTADSVVLPHSQTYSAITLDDIDIITPVERHIFLRQSYSAPCMSLYDELQQVSKQQQKNSLYKSDISTTCSCDKRERDVAVISNDIAHTPVYDVTDGASITVSSLTDTDNVSQTSQNNTYTSTARLTLSQQINTLNNSEQKKGVSSSDSFELLNNGIETQNINGVHTDAISSVQNLIENTEHRKIMCDNHNRCESDNNTNVYIALQGASQDIQEDLSNSVSDKSQENATIKPGSTLNENKNKSLNCFGQVNDFVQKDIVVGDAGIMSETDSCLIDLNSNASMPVVSNVTMESGTNQCAANHFSLDYYLHSHGSQNEQNAVFVDPDSNTLSYQDSLEDDEVLDLPELEVEVVHVVSGRCDENPVKSPELITYDSDYLPEGDEQATCYQTTRHNVPDIHIPSADDQTPREDEEDSIHLRRGLIHAEIEMYSPGRETEWSGSLLPSLIPYPEIEITSPSPQMSPQRPLSATNEITEENNQVEELVLDNEVITDVMSDNTEQLMAADLRLDLSHLESSQDTDDLLKNDFFDTDASNGNDLSPGGFEGHINNVVALAVAQQMKRMNTLAYIMSPGQFIGGENSSPTPLDILNSTLTGDTADLADTDKADADNQYEMRTSTPVSTSSTASLTTDASNVSDELMKILNTIGTRSEKVCSELDLAYAREMILQNELDTSENDMAHVIKNTQNDKDSLSDEKRVLEVEVASLTRVSKELHHDLTCITDSKTHCENRCTKLENLVDRLQAHIDEMEAKKIDTSIHSSQSDCLEQVPVSACQVFSKAIQTEALQPRVWSVGIQAKPFHYDSFTQTFELLDPQRAIPDDSSIESSSVITQPVLPPAAVKRAYTSLPSSLTSSPVSSIDAQAKYHHKTHPAFDKPNRMLDQILQHMSSIASQNENEHTPDTSFDGTIDGSGGNAVYREISDELKNIFNQEEGDQKWQRLSMTPLSSDPIVLALQQSLTSCLFQQDLVNNRVKKRNTELNYQVDKLSENLDETLSELSRTKQECEVIQVKRSGDQGEMDILKDRIARLEKALCMGQIENERLQCKLEEALTLLTAKHINEEDQKKKAGATDVVQDEMLEKVKALQSEKEHLQKTLSELQTESVDRQSALGHLETSLTGTQSEKQLLSAEVLVLREEYNQLRQAVTIMESLLLSDTTKTSVDVAQTGRSKLTTEEQLYLKRRLVELKEHALSAFSADPQLSSSLFTNAAVTSAKPNTTAEKTSYVDRKRASIHSDIMTQSESVLKEITDSQVPNNEPSLIVHWQDVRNSIATQMTREGKSVSNGGEKENVKKTESVAVMTDDLSKTVDVEKLVPLMKIIEGELVKDSAPSSQNMTTPDPIKPATDTVTTTESNIDQTLHKDIHIPQPESTCKASPDDFTSSNTSGYASFVPVPSTSHQVITHTRGVNSPLVSSIPSSVPHPETRLSTALPAETATHNRPTMSQSKINYKQMEKDYDDMRKQRLALLIHAYTGRTDKDYQTGHTENPADQYREIQKPPVTTKVPRPTALPTTELASRSKSSMSSNTYPGEPETYQFDESRAIRERLRLMKERLCADEDLLFGGELQDEYVNSSEVYTEPAVPTTQDNKRAVDSIIRRMDIPRDTPKVYSRPQRQIYPHKRGYQPAGMAYAEDNITDEQLSQDAMEREQIYLHQKFDSYGRDSLRQNGHGRTEVGEEHYHSLPGNLRHSTHCDHRPGDGQYNPAASERKTYNSSQRLNRDLQARSSSRDRIVSRDRSASRDRTYCDQWVDEVHRRCDHQYVQDGAGVVYADEDCTVGDEFEDEEFPADYVDMHRREAQRAVHDYRRSPAGRPEHVDNLDRGTGQKTSQYYTERRADVARPNTGLSFHGRDVIDRDPHYTRATDAATSGRLFDGKGYFDREMYERPSSQYSSYSQRNESSDYRAERTRDLNALLADSSSREQARSDEDKYRRTKSDITSPHIVNCRAQYESNPVSREKVPSDAEYAAHPREQNYSNTIAARPGILRNSDRENTDIMGVQRSTLDPSLNASPLKNMRNNTSVDPGRKQTYDLPEPTSTSRYELQRHVSPPDTTHLDYSGPDLQTSAYSHHSQTHVPASEDKTSHSGTRDHSRQLKSRSESTLSDQDLVVTKSGDIMRRKDATPTKDQTKTAATRCSPRDSPVENRDVEKHDGRYWSEPRRHGSTARSRTSGDSMYWTEPRQHVKKRESSTTRRDEKVEVVKNLKSEFEAAESSGMRSLPSDQRFSVRGSEEPPDRPCTPEIAVRVEKTPLTPEQRKYADKLVQHYTTAQDSSIIPAGNVKYADQLVQRYTTAQGKTTPTGDVKHTEKLVQNYTTPHDNTVIPTGIPTGIVDTDRGMNQHNIDQIISRYSKRAEENNCTTTTVTNKPTDNITEHTNRSVVEEGGTRNVKQMGDSEKQYVDDIIKKYTSSQEP